MARKKKGYGEPLVVGNHTVQIIEVSGAERLLVDGVRHAYVAAPNGFTLRAAIYDEPSETLLEAGTRFAKKLDADDGAAEAEGD